MEAQELDLKKRKKCQNGRKSASEHQIQKLNSGYFIQLGLFLVILGSVADLWPFCHF